QERSPETSAAPPTLEVPLERLQVGCHAPLEERACQRRQQGGRTRQALAGDLSLERQARPAAGRREQVAVGEGRRTAEAAERHALVRLELADLHLVLDPALRQVPDHLVPGACAHG